MLYRMKRGILEMSRFALDCLATETHWLAMTRFFDNLTRKQIPEPGICFQGAFIWRFQDEERHYFFRKSGRAFPSLRHW